MYNNNILNLSNRKEVVINKSIMSFHCYDNVMTRRKSCEVTGKIGEVIKRSYSKDDVKRILKKKFKDVYENKKTSSVNSSIICSYKSYNEANRKTYFGVK